MVHAGDVGFSAAASFDVATLDPDVVARRTLELLTITVGQGNRYSLTRRFD
jgi:hypothetical protein